jgi:hypothetical protein
MYCSPIIHVYSVLARTVLHTCCIGAKSGASNCLVGIRANCRTAPLISIRAAFLQFTLYRYGYVLRSGRQAVGESALHNSRSVRERSVFRRSTEEGKWRWGRLGFKEPNFPADFAFRAGTSAGFVASLVGIVSR